LHITTKNSGYGLSFINERMNLFLRLSTSR